MAALFDFAGVFAFVRTLAFAATFFFVVRFFVGVVFFVAERLRGGVSELAMIDIAFNRRIGVYEISKQL